MVGHPVSLNTLVFETETCFLAETIVLVIQNLMIIIQVVTAYHWEEVYPLADRMGGDNPTTTWG